MISRIYQNLPPLIAGITIAKTAVFAIGIVVFLCLPLFGSEPDPVQRWALLFWYPTIAGVAGASNIVDMPSIRIKLPPWWLRTPLIGAWLNLVVVLFAPGTMQDHSVVAQLSFDPFDSQFLFVLDGAILGLLAGFISMRVWHRRVQQQT